jgi:MarR family 2-MHQ and catechol resistance regulon transcriptional repressor
MHNNGKSDKSISGPKLWVVLARAYGAMASYVQDRIAAEGLGLSDFMVLEVLLHKGAMSISAIGEKVLLANASMTAAVDRLEERGYVIRQSSESDRRSKIVALTSEGRALIFSLYARHARDIEAVTSALSLREQDQLHSLLKKLGLSAKAATWQRGQESRPLSQKQSAKERQR